MSKASPKQVVCLGVFNPDGAMLWGKRKDNQSYTTIAGSMEGDESPTEAAIREAKEEGDLDLTEEDCQYIGCKHIKSGEMIVHVFKVKAPADYVPSCKNDPDDEFVEGSLKFVDIKHGLPAKIANNLHIPEGHNVLLQLMPIEYLDLIKTEDAQLVAGLSAKPTGPKPVKAKAKPEPEKNLVVTHNLSEAGLHHAHELGGLAAPSIAIAHKDHPLSSFGEITLVGDHTLVDPKQGVPVFDADVYSPRHPRAKFALNEKKWTNFARDIREHAKLTGDSSFSDQSIERDLADNGKLSDPRYVPHSQNALASLFLKEKGVAVPTQNRPKKIGRYPWVQSQHIQELRNSPALSTNIVFGSPEHKTLSEAVKRAVQNHKYTDTGTTDELDEKDNQIMREQTLEHLFNEDGTLSYGRMDNIVTQAKKVGESEHDPDHYNEQVSKLIEPHKEDFNHWKTAKEKELVGERYIPKHVDSAYGPKTRKLPYTLSNIVKEVTNKPVRGGENFNYGLGSTRAIGAKKFRSVEDIQKDRHKIIDNKSFKAQREQLDNEFTDFLSANDLSSSPVLEAMGESYKKGKYLHRELKESGLDLQPHQVAKIAEFAHRLRNLPTEYFEAKPQRAVGLHEFKGAVVPHTASEHTKQLLRNMGLHVETYDSSDQATNDDGSNNQRRDAINKIAQMKALHLSDASQYKLETVTKTGIDIQPESFDEENWEDNEAPAEDLSKSLSDIPKGRKLTSTQWGPVHSYTHMLPPELVKDGYRMTVETRDFGDPGEHGIGAKIWHKAKEAGTVSGMLHFKPSVARVRFSSVDNPHRGKGLGKLAYEALLVHAKHLGIGRVKGDEHSTAASAVHQHLSQKHGMDYKPEPSTVGDKQPGDFDGRFAPYEYVLKGESSNSDIQNILRDLSQQNPEQVNTHLSGLDSKSRMILSDYVSQYNEQANKRATGTDSPSLMYHGTPHHAKIMQSGFELTPGVRSSGFMGAPKTVQNQGIFVTPSKQFGHFFGQNRSDHPSDYKVLPVYVNSGNVLDLTKMPTQLNSHALRLVNNYYGTKKGRLASDDYHWIVDQPEFVDAVKQHGFHSVSFPEAVSTTKVAGIAPQDRKSHPTLMVFDPSRVQPHRHGLQTMTDLIEHAKQVTAPANESQVVDEVQKSENLNVIKEALRNAPEHQRSSMTDWHDMGDDALAELVCEGLLDVDHVLLNGPSSYALETLANCPDKKVSLPAKIVRGLGEDVDHVLLYDPKLVPWKYASYGFRNQYLSLAKDKLPHNVFDAACRYMKAVKPVSTRAAISVPGQLAKSFAPTTEQLLEWVVVNEPLSKSFKHQLMGLAAASILSGSAQAQPKDPIQMDQTRGFGATSADAQTVHVPGKFDAKRSWTMQGLHPELVALAGNESAGGLLWGHAAHSGGEFETAYGPLGMKPSTGLEHFVNDPTLRKIYPNIAPLSQHPLELKKNPQVQAAFLKEFQTNPHLYNTVAGKEWNRLKSVFNGNIGHSALGWRWGENGARKQIETGLTPESEKYVQDFHKHYGRVINDRAAEIISKTPQMAKVQ